VLKVHLEEWVSGIDIDLDLDIVSATEASPSQRR
jgi:hypothetical protein